MTNKLTAREQLELIDAIPHGPAREKMLRLMLAEAWHEGWKTAYNDGGQDSNAYMTGREIRERSEQIKADHDAYVLALVTGSKGATAERIAADGSKVTGTYTAAHCAEIDEPFVLGAKPLPCGRLLDENGRCRVHGDNAKRAL